MLSHTDTFGLLVNKMSSSPAPFIPSLPDHRPSRDHFLNSGAFHLSRWLDQTSSRSLLMRVGNVHEGEARCYCDLLSLGQSLEMGNLRCEHFRWRKAQALSVRVSDEKVKMSLACQGRGMTTILRWSTGGSLQPAVSRRKIHKPRRQCRVALKSLLCWKGSRESKFQGREVKTMQT